MGYFVKASNGEISGPYEAGKISGWIYQGLLEDDIALCAEGESAWRPAHEQGVLRNGPRQVMESVPRSGAAAGGEGLSAPPRSPLQSPPQVGTDEGDFWLGFGLGICCGGIALLGTFVTEMKPQTKRGVWMGFAAGTLMGLTFRLLAAEPHSSRYGY